MPRADLSNDLIHWIKGDTDDEAFEIMRRIVSENRLLGGNGHIKGEYTCVCFTEAPENTFHNVIGRYRPFGIQVSKKWAYSQGGRPVIYQEDNEYYQLPESHRWRHVRYEPNETSPIDFTWEREWRIQTNELILPNTEASIIIPNNSYASILEQDHYDNEGTRIQMEALAYGDERLLQFPVPFLYSYSVINV